MYDEEIKQVTQSKLASQESTTQGLDESFAIGTLLSNPYVISAASAIALYAIHKVIGKLYGPSLPTPFSNSTALADWEDLGDDRIIVHAVRSRYRTTSPLFKKQAQKVLEEWDVISTSLVDTGLIKANKSAGVGDRYTGLGYSVGFILKVPPQNIIGTHPHDVSFPNHLKGRKLADAFFSGTSANADNELKHPHYNLLMSPDKLLSQRNRMILKKEADYNEVIIVGRENINVYEGYGVTRKVEVKGIVIIPQAATGIATNDERETLSMLSKVNPKLPCYYVNKGKLTALP